MRRRERRLEWWNDGSWKNGMEDRNNIFIKRYNINIWKKEGILTGGIKNSESGRMQFHCMYWPPISFPDFHLNMGRYYQTVLMHVTVFQEIFLKDIVEEV